jgi:hypothetical protein
MPLPPVVVVVPAARRLRDARPAAAAAAAAPAVVSAHASVTRPAAAAAATAAAAAAAAATAEQRIVQRHVAREHRFLVARGVALAAELPHCVGHRRRSGATSTSGAPGRGWGPRLDRRPRAAATVPRGVERVGRGGRGRGERRCCWLPLLLPPLLLLLLLLRRRRRGAVLNQSFAKPRMR